MDATTSLVSRARSGDREAFGMLAQQHMGMLVRIAYQMTGDYETTQELAQEAVLEAYLSLRQLRDDALFRSWLYGIGVNVCRSYLRSRKAPALSFEDLLGGTHRDGVVLLDSSPSLEEIVERRELHRRLLDAVQSLTTADREAVLLFYYNGLSIREAAAILDITPGALRVRLHKARAHLRRQLFDHETVNEMEVQPMLPVEVLEIMYTPSDGEDPPNLNSPIILLLDEVNERVLPIWVGPHEGQLIQMTLNNSPFPRPMTWNFTSNLLSAVGAQVESVTVSKLVEEVYYAITRLRFGDTVHEIDSRPSDAIGLALNTQSPIFVAEAVMNQTGIQMGKAFKAGLGKRKRMSRLSAEEMAKHFPPAAPSADIKMPTPEELEAARNQAQQRVKAIIGQ